MLAALALLLFGGCCLSFTFLDQWISFYHCSLRLLAWLVGETYRSSSSPARRLGTAAPHGFLRDGPVVDEVMAWQKEPLTDLL
jgi:hypothetical protein